MTVTSLPLLLLCLLLQQRSTLALPTTESTTDATTWPTDQEIIFVEEVVRYTPIAKANGERDSKDSTVLLTLESDDGSTEANNDGMEKSSNEVPILITDDLIVTLDKSAQPKHHQEEPERKDTSSSSSSEEETTTDNSKTERNSAEEDESDESDNSDCSSNTVPPIDMSDFIGLIPTTKVKSIVRTYYKSDLEVQRAYAFFASRDFQAIKQHLLLVPEVKAFINYLNASGLNIVGFVQAITNVTFIADTETGVTVKKELTPPPPPPLPPTTISSRESPLGNEIERQQQLITTTMQPTTIMEEEPSELNGLHGLVDSILDVLPQDQILSTFFDKLETNQQFSKLVESLGSPAFGKIISDMQNSLALRNLIFTLHNNGIYITRIVDSLKAYFFLGTF